MFLPVKLNPENKIAAIGFKFDNPSILYEDPSTSNTWNIRIQIRDSSLWS